MPPKRVLVVALLVALAGCTGLGTTDDETTTESTAELTTAPTTDTTTESTTESTTDPHTHQGTSHHADHFSVRAGSGVTNLTVTLAPEGDSETYAVSAGESLELTEEIHERGHEVDVVVERGDEVVFDATIYGYEYYDVTVHENDTAVQLSQV